MKDGPDIARIASLIGDPARANMLCAVVDGRALTAGELAAEGGVSKQTASAHLARLSEAGLLAVETQGRHKYFRIADADVAHAIEALMSVAQRGGGRRVRTGPRDEGMRRARVCYDHLAGALAVELMDRWLARGWFAAGTARDGRPALALTEAGRRAFRNVGIDLASLEEGRRPLCRPCLDWSMRRHHLAGALGGAFLDLAIRERWLAREAGTRLVRVIDAGAMAQALG